MKKSLIALLLVVALVVTVSVFAVSAADTNPFEDQTGTVIADCPYCGADQTWYPVLSTEYSTQMKNWTGATEAGGHFYCTEDWTDGSSDTLTTEKFCLNLNGKVITRTNSTWFVLNGADAETAPVLNIMDTSAEQTGEMDSGAKSGNNFFNGQGYGTVNVYSGIISAYGSKMTAGSSSNPTLVKANDTTSACTFNFYGGTLKGYSQYTAGLMNIGGSTVVNIDGAVLDGKGGTNTVKVSGANAKLYLKSGSLTGASMSSGKDGCAVVVEGGAYFEMTGGTLTGTNTSTSVPGGALRVANGSAQLKGGTITGTANEGGAVGVYGASATVTLDGATIQDSSATIAAANQKGGGAVCITNGNFIMKSGTIKDSTATSHGGAVLIRGGTFTMEGGTIQNCSANQGGAVYISGSSSKILMSGGTIKECTATSATGGGAILIQYQSQGSIISGTALIEDCSAPNGGAIALNGSGTPTVTINGGTIQNCYTTKASGAMGGSIYDVSSAGAVINLNGGTISGGKADDGNGGNIYITKAASQLNITDGTITKGTALRVNGTSNGNGGNIYMAAGTLNMSGGTISGGLDTNNAQHAGNIYAAGSTVNITGGTITGGRCGSYGGNLYAYDCVLNIDAAEGKTVKITNGVAAAGGNLYIRESAGSVDTASATITGPDVTISGGDAGGNNGTGASAARAQCGSQIMLYGVESNPCVLTLKDVAIDSSETHTDEIALYEYAELKVGGEKKVDCAYMTNNTSKVTILEGFSGDIHVRWFDADQIATVVTGGEVDASLQHEVAYTGTGVVKACNASRSGKICALSATSETGFVIASFGGFNYDEDGKAVETALAAMPTDENAFDFVRSYLDNGATIELAANTTLDLNNGEFDVKTNGFELNLIESRTNEFDYEKGYVTVDDETKVNTKVQLANGNQYIVLAEKVEGEATKFTAHRVQVDIDSVSIKPTTAGIYYTTNMNTTLEASQYAVSYGVVLSLVDMPGANFVTDDSNEDEIIDNLYTEIDFNLADDERVAVKNANSALLTGILNQGAPAGQNKEWGEKPIFANAFVCFNIDGVDHYFMADKTYELSLLDILTIVNDTNPSHTSVLTMYENWQDPMYEWATEAQPNENLPRLAAIKAAYDEANA